MTREELKDICNKSIAIVKSWPGDGEKLNSNKLYQEYTLILEMLEQGKVFDKIKTIVEKWHSDSWTDNLSYECMCEISELIEPQESEGE